MQELTSTRGIPAKHCRARSLARKQAARRVYAMLSMPAIAGGTPGESLGVCGQTCGVPAVVTGELTLEV